MRILVAGIGNIFFGDDAFGCEVMREMTGREWPNEVTARDFGIRSYDLAYAIIDHDVSILIDATPRGSAPGTVYLIEPDLNQLDEEGDEVVNAHSMNPVRVLQMVRSFGGAPRQLLVVGCEPGILEPEDGVMGLSEKVRAAIPGAIALIDELIRDLLAGKRISAEPQKIESKAGSGAIQATEKPI